MANLERCAIFLIPLTRCTVSLERGKEPHEVARRLEEALTGFHENIERNLATFADRTAAVNTYQAALRLSFELKQALWQPEEVQEGKEPKERKLGFYPIKFESDLLEPMDEETLKLFYGDS